MEQLTLATAVLVAGGALAFALALLTATDGVPPSPWQRFASYALTLPAQGLLAGLGFLLYVGLVRVDPDRLAKLVVSCGSLLAVVTGAYVHGILAAIAPARARALATACVVGLGALALAALLGAASG
jgi:hypothetical protein